MTTQKQADAAVQKQLDFIVGSYRASPDDVIEMLGFIDPQAIDNVEINLLTQLRIIARSMGVYIAKGREWPIRDSFKAIIKYANNPKEKLPACLQPSPGEELRDFMDMPDWRTEARIQFSKGLPTEPDSRTLTGERAKTAEQNLEKTFERASALMGDTVKKMSAMSVGDGISQNPLTAETTAMSPAAEDSEKQGPVAYDGEYSKYANWVSRAIQAAYKFPNNTQWDVNSDKDLIEVITIFEKNMRVAKVPQSAYVEALSLWLRDGASLFYMSNIEGKVTDYEEALDLLMKQYYDQPTTDHFLNEWASLTFGKFREKADEDWTALSQLYTRVCQLQRILGPRYKGDELTLQQIKMAMRDTEAYKSISTNHFESTAGLMSSLRTALQNHPTNIVTTSAAELTTSARNQVIGVPDYGNQRYREPQQVAC